MTIESPAIPFVVLRRNWGWFVALGILLVVLGSVALSELAFAAFVVIYFIGGVALFAGGAHVAHAFVMRGWNGFFVNLLVGILDIFIGSSSFPSQSLVSLP